MKVGLILGVLSLSGICMAQSVSTKGESLDKVQVLALLAGDVSTSRVASLIVERGITFEPRDRYIQLLQKVGADDGVITAVRVAQRPPAGSKAEGAPPENAPLERDQILDLLQTGVDNDLLAKLVATRGIDFEPFDEYLHVYEIAGAQESLLSVLREAGRPKSGAGAATIAPPKGEGEKPTEGGGAGKRIRVSAEKAESGLIFQPKPEYPPLAKTARIQGTVRLGALIGKDGTIEELKVLSGPALLIKATMDAVSKWRYKPPRVKGLPVEVETEIDVNYVLEL